MAKRNSEATQASDKAKVRIVYAEVEGNNESIQDALKTMVAAISRPVRIISDHQTDRRSAALIEQVGSQVVDDDLQEEEEAERSVETHAPPVPRKTRGTGKKSDRNAGLSLVPDLDFMPAGKPTLKSFSDEKRPKSDLEAVLIAVYYMQNFSKVAKIGPSHVLTALKEMGVPAPADLRQTLRNAQNSRVWLSFSQIEEIRTATQGDNHIEHKMGKNEKS